jgi:hypothetical protein
VAATRDFESHRSDWVAVRRQPVRIGQEEFASRLEFHVRRVQRSTQTTENFVTPFRWFPFDGIAAQWTRYADGLLGLPPRSQRSCVEERVQHLGRRRHDNEVSRELEHASLCTFDV